MSFNVTVDPNNVLGTSVEEAGKYNVRVLPTSEAKQTSTGKEMAVLNYEVTDGDYTGGQIRYDNIVWDESDADAMKRSQKSFNTSLVAAGVDAGVQVNSIDQFVKGMIGKEMSLTVDWREWNGNINLNVKAHNPKLPDGSEPNGVTRDMYAAKNGIEQANGNSVNSTTSHQQAKQTGFNPFSGSQVNISDDDLPF
ncbi:DUF669 domain-containing protein [Convivina praedatoris]|uniref:DUF669 domain-containing protein n=1 Tax=Convivina praedatoris TaxID=2880963 RepID=A0ABN8HE24_9LACO|nr:DUF669 domain-containing protein [Convivina sp. LMG 32447]CAH1855903.1 hypothetical protein LMG032447_01193 [Convivina sp. LMG 32447]